MTVNQAETYFDHPLYRQAMQHLQKGEWQPGLSKLDQLMHTYSLEPGLRALRQEMVLRSKIDQDEIKDKAIARRRRLKNLAIRLVVVGVLAVLGIYVLRSYSIWFQDQITFTRQNLEYQLGVMDLAIKFRDAQDYLNAGRTEAAIALLNDIAIREPDYPGLTEAMQQAQKIQVLDAQYAKAMQSLAHNDPANAMLILKEIEIQEPYYRDVKVQIQNLEQQTLLNQLVSQADANFEAGKWEEAIVGYESAYAMDPESISGPVEEHLFTSYINAAEQLLKSSNTLDAIQKAEDNFRKALALRPQDSAVKAKQSQVRAMVEERMFWNYVQAAQAAVAEEPDSLVALRVAEDYLTRALAIRPKDNDITLQREMAHRYLQAQEEFTHGGWDMVIENLEFIYGQDTGYAKGTARHTLYEAYVARGDSAMAIGDFKAALENYRRAAVIAEEDPSSKLRLYEIQLKIAEALGITGEYEPAVLLYSAAIDLAGLKERAPQFNSAMAAALEEAENYARLGNYKSAYRSYRDAVAWSDQTFETVNYTVESGDYLSSLALKFNSTVSLIAVANNLANPNLIIAGQDLIIPIIP